MAVKTVVDCLPGFFMAFYLLFRFFEESGSLYNYLLFCWWLKAPEIATTEVAIAKHWQIVLAIFRIL